MSDKTTYRCAIYTRKSTEDGLEQDFNSLDAQREACEAYISSQTGLGWKPVPTRYDDGGISGGTMDRPALQQLLSDIKAGCIDVVVVYKIDRLTRSLMDFSKIVDVFDAQGVSFVSITQQFNTTTSMGRLTLNVLLSFAQFEREVTAERIRDKIAASKKKGMWMGGPPPLGYDVRDKQLIVNEAEAGTVRRLFQLYLETGSVRRLKERADSLDITTKHRCLKDGRTCGGKPFSRGNLYLFLSNPVYIGKVVHHGDSYPGRHDAIVDLDLWTAVQDRMVSNTRERRSATNVRSASILTGLIFDETGDRLSPSHAIKNGIRYHYYISRRLMYAERRQNEGWRLPANEIERPVVNVLCDHLADQRKLVDLINLEGCSANTHQAACLAADRLSRKLRKSAPTEQQRILASFAHRIEIHPGRLILELDGSKLRYLLADNETPDQGDGSEKHIRKIELEHQLKRRGVEAKLVLTGTVIDSPNRDRHLIRIVAKAHLWLAELSCGNALTIDELAKQQNEDSGEVSRFLPLAYLAPDIIEAILEGKQPVDLTAERLRRIPLLPHAWNEQRERLGFAG